MLSLRAERQGGFTLVEVLVAFAVAAVLLVPLLRLFSGGINELTRGEGTETAALWARTLLDSADGGRLSAGSASGVLPGGYRWERDAALYTDPAITETARPLVPYAVTVTITWRERNRDRSFSLETLRLAPPPGTPP